MTDPTPFLTLRYYKDGSVKVDKDATQVPVGKTALLAMYGSLAFVTHGTLHWLNDLVQANALEEALVLKWLESVDTKGVH